MQFIMVGVYSSDLWGGRSGNRYESELRLLSKLLSVLAAISLLHFLKK